MQRRNNGHRGCEEVNARGMGDLTSAGLHTYLLSSECESHPRQKFQAIATAEIGAAISSWNRASSVRQSYRLTMTVEKSPYDYYARYAPTTHGLKLPPPLYNFPRGREFYKGLGEPKRIVAPMVDQSELVQRYKGRRS